MNARRNQSQKELTEKIRRQLSEERGVSGRLLTQTEMSKIIGVSQATISKALGGKTIEIEMARKILDSVGLPRMENLICFDCEAEEEDLKFDNKKDISGNQPSEGNEDKEEPMSLLLQSLIALFGRENVESFTMPPHAGTVHAGTPDWTDRENLTPYSGLPLYKVIVCGDSMVDREYRDGDEIIIEENSNAQIGDDVVAIVEGQPIFKILAKKHTNGRTRYTLQPANCKYREIDQEDIEIQGRAIKVIKNTKDERADRQLIRKKDEEIAELRRQLAETKGEI